MENLKKIARDFAVDVIPFVRGADRGGLEIANLVASAIAAGISIGKAEAKKEAEAKPDENKNHG